MSIYGSLDAPCDDYHEDDCARWLKRGDIWDISDSPCDCGQPDAPLVYQGSHVLPSITDERGGSVDIASISGHITRDGLDNGADEDTPLPFLRFGVNEQTVVLTPRHVRTIMESLGWWLSAVASELPPTGPES